MRNPIIYFKSCPRCSGDMTPEEDVFGRYSTCLACGHVNYLDSSDDPLSDHNAKSYGAAVIGEQLVASM